MEDDIRKLIDTYERLLCGHQSPAPVEMTTKEQYRLEGYDAAILRFISELKDVLYRIRFDTDKSKLGFTE